MCNDVHYICMHIGMSTTCLKLDMYRIYIVLTHIHLNINIYDAVGEVYHGLAFSRNCANNGLKIEKTHNKVTLEWYPSRKNYGWWDSMGNQSTIKWFQCGFTLNPSRLGHIGMALSKNGVRAVYH